MEGIDNKGRKKEKKKQRQEFLKQVHFYCTMTFPCGCHDSLSYC